VGTVEEQEGDALFGSDAQSIAQGATELVDAPGQIGVADAFVATLDGGLAAAALGEVTIDEVRRGVERRGYA
jgi:hypothetical protein